ncbi:holin family protein [Pseudorhodobacter sp. W20_MBD10_FR17]|uniref:holin family protein n=1 Tax=Pseudorhodobacter sp. W20_MBD10_FR17 TaxID=3240266 RepID=UPI003F97874C
MGVISNLFGGATAVSSIGGAVRDVAEVFTPSATKKMELSAEAQVAALRQLGAEYADPGLGWFDRMVNGLNRLPRPLLAFGTLGLFVYAMIEPVSFGERMVGLNLVPDPLWWLLGAVVGFYFGAREAHYFRRPVPVVTPPADRVTVDAEPNLALADWRAKP